MLSAIREFVKKTPLFPVVRRIGDLFIPAPPSNPLRWQTIKDYGKKFNVKCFVETGTYLGDTVEAVKNDFATIYSIELSEQLAKDAQERFKNDPHIKIVQGDSKDALPQVLSSIHEPILFWLDAHCSLGKTVWGDTLTPIMEELKNIFTLAKDPVILIDDARDFSWYSVVIRGRKDYPTMGALKKFVKKLNPEYKVTASDGIIRICK